MYREKNISNPVFSPGRLAYNIIATPSQWPYLFDVMVSVVTNSTHSALNFPAWREPYEQ